MSRTVTLTPNGQKTLEEVYLKKIRECNKNIREATKPENKEWHRMIRRKYIMELQNVRDGFTFE